MPFTSYTSLGEAAKAFSITLRFDKFLAPLVMPVSQQLKDDLIFATEHIAMDSSETAVCEALIFPMLKEVWKCYTDTLTLWSHMPLSYSAELSGICDYFVARKSPLGHWVMEKPHVLIMETKKDDFSKGWGQCLAAMLAAQGINGKPDMPIYGITTNGRYWEFARLVNTTLTREARSYTSSDLEMLCAVLNFIFEQCRQQVADPSKAA